MDLEERELEILVKRAKPPRVKALSVWVATSDHTAWTVNEGSEWVKLTTRMPVGNWVEYD